MPTLWSQSLIPTLREAPAEAEVPSHQLMLRAGLIRKVGSGMYSYLPLGWRSLRKAMAIVREEMAAAGAEEVHLPALIPIEFYQQTGRDVAYGDNLFRVKDRHGRAQALGPTHEEIITELVGAFCGSYRDLPKTLYQIQTKFRDEFRPRFGVLRSREFQMKDAYSFHTTLEGPGGLNETYQKQYDAYCRIFSRCGLPYLTVEAESGPIGGSASHEFMVPSPTGEDTILESDRSNYAANVEKCEIGSRKFSSHFAGGDLPAVPPSGPLEKIHTPNCPGIEDVSKLLKVKPRHMLKTLVRIAATYDGPDLEKWINDNKYEYSIPPSGEDRVAGGQNTTNTKVDQWWFVYCVLRGDHDLNVGKLNKHLSEAARRPVKLLEEAKFLESHGVPIGFVGPQAALQNRLIQVVVDPDAAIDQFWVTGANEVDHHVKHFHWNRDVLDPLNNDRWRVKIADIRNALDGDPSPKNDGGTLRTRKGIEVGHVFKLGDKYTKAMNVTTLMPDNSRIHPIMGCYGIGVNRILAAAIEREGGHDENGILWPAAIAPYSVVITVMKYEGALKEAACGLAQSLEAQGLEVLIDDRDERPGVKFKDADLIGIPVRITVGEKGLAEGKVEIKARRPGLTSLKGDLVPRAEVPSKVTQLLQSM